MPQSTKPRGENNVAAKAIQQMAQAAQNIAAMVVMFMLISTAVDAWRGRNLDPQAVPLMTYTDLQGTTEDWLERSYSEPVIVYFGPLGVRCVRT